MNDPSVLRMLGELLDGAHLAAPDQLPDVIASAALQIGWTASVYLADYEQVVLVPLLPEGVWGEQLLIESTVAGRAFRLLQSVPVAHGAQLHLWVPIVDGVERLGVMNLGLPADIDLDAREFIDSVRWFAHLSGHLIAAKGPYGDTYHRLRSRRPRTVASELVWSMLPPLTTAVDGLVISAILEPAHAVAGDMFDYSIASDRAKVAIIDATGHDIHSGVIGAVAVSAYRNARHRELALPAITRHVDDALSELGLDTYATGVFGDLDLRTGQFSMLNAGHPSPLVLRNGRVVKSLDNGRRTLLGLAPRPAADTIATEQLEPGDWLILYTDGVTEARDDQRAFFGLERFIDIIERCSADDQSAPETVRRIAGTVLEYQQGVLQDDATIMIVQWRTNHEVDLYAI
ncbi:MAG: SpoIIE family protein phosphatase [Ilumatobacteraceae bacterium]